ncbi:hypothetical protein DAI22_03g261450 [Oryza sativa Japonica Group]|nr:hypothetical protein DAI22_03g261450 [Oryza sativa Japonica Group]
MDTSPSHHHQAKQPNNCSFWKKELCTGLILPIWPYSLLFSAWRGLFLLICQGLKVSRTADTCYMLSPLS